MRPLARAAAIREDVLPRSEDDGDGRSGSRTAVEGFGTVVAAFEPGGESPLRAREKGRTDEGSQVVSGVVKLHYYLAPPARLAKIVRPLLRLLDSSLEVQALALEDCAVIADERPVRPFSLDLRFLADFGPPRRTSSLLTSQSFSSGFRNPSSASLCGYASLSHWRRRRTSESCSTSSSCVLSHLAG